MDLRKSIGMCLILVSLSQSIGVDGDELGELLSSLKFLNAGIVNSTDRFAWKTQPCSYLEAWNVSTIQNSWAVAPTHNYLYRKLPDGELVPPPSGMRSAVPLGGISTGSIELRANGKFHEWTIINQTPASAAKIQVFDEAMFGVWTKTYTKPNHPDDRLLFQRRQQDFKNPGDHIQNYQKVSQSKAAFVLQTHPENPSLPGVQSLRYQGAYPVSKLDVLDDRLPVKVSLYGYSTYKLNDSMEYSATPGIAFTVMVSNPSTTDTVDVALFLNMPIGVEKMTTRKYPATSGQDPEPPLAEIPNSSEEVCFRLCHTSAACKTWNFKKSTGLCTLHQGVYLNTFDGDSSSGLRGYWAKDSVDDHTSCISLVREGTLGPHGNLSVCPTNDGVAMKKMSFGVGDSLVDLWREFEENGYLTQSVTGENKNIHGAATINMTLLPGQTDHFTIVLAWYYPHRDFVGVVRGNYYANLSTDSLSVAKRLADDRVDILTNIQKVHKVMFDSSVPVFLQDLLINSLSHIRSAMWFGNGLWRQWEANDCTNMDSVHNDGERHIPYIMFFPSSTRNKIYGWAKSQLANGMIPEQLRCNPSGPSTNIDVPCGRVMSDVSSMFIVYLLEMYQWSGDDMLLDDLWPHAKNAAKWHMDVSNKSGIPMYLQNTYDVLGLNAYPFSTYNSAFHLLAMRACEELAKIKGDLELAQTCHNAFIRGQKATETILWNEERSHYEAYIKQNDDFNLHYKADHHNLLRKSEHRRKFYAKGHWFDMPSEEGAPSGAIMTDSFYAQVLAFTLGLGPLVNTTRLKLHLQAELTKNDSPYGLLVMTGRYPYPGPWTDNAVWMMGNPNWASLNLHLGLDVDDCINVAKKSLDTWRSTLNDQWNIAGIIGGLGYQAEGQPYITSHYGYFMSSWHILFALSGQQANLPKGTLTFMPKVKDRSKFKLPVLLPVAYGQISAAVTGTQITYTLALEYGMLNLTYLAVGGSVYPDLPVSITSDKSVSWFDLQ